MIPVIISVDNIDLLHCTLLLHTSTDEMIKLVNGKTASLRMLAQEIGDTFKALKYFTYFLPHKLVKDKDHLLNHWNFQIKILQGSLWTTNNISPTYISSHSKTNQASQLLHMLSHKPPSFFLFNLLGSIEPWGTYYRYVQKRDVLKETLTLKLLFYNNAWICFLCICVDKLNLEKLWKNPIQFVRKLSNIYCRIMMLLWLIRWNIKE